MRQLSVETKYDKGGAKGDLPVRALANGLPSARPGSDGHSNGAVGPGLVRAHGSDYGTPRFGKHENEITIPGSHQGTADREEQERVGQQPVRVLGGDALENSVVYSVEVGHSDLSDSRSGRQLRLSPTGRRRVPRWTLAPRKSCSTADPGLSIAVCYFLATYPQSVAQSSRVRCSVVTSTPASLRTRTLRFRDSSYLAWCWERYADA